jgi:hypothetical protein
LLGVAYHIPGLHFLIVLYSPTMLDNRLMRLVHGLRGWGLDGLAAGLLESGGPLPYLGAQALHFAAPLLQPFDPAGHLDGLAQLLEDPDQVAAMAAALQSEAEATRHA